MKIKKTSIFNSLFLFGMAGILGSLLTILGPSEPKTVSTTAIVEKILMEESTLLKGALRTDFVPYLVAIAKDHELDPLLVLAVMKVESSFKPNARSHAGALGLLQLKPIAAREAAKVFDIEWVGSKRLMNPFFNVKTGVQYLAYLKRLVGRDKIKILSAYNLGPTHVKRSPSHSHKYAKKVLKVYGQFLKRYSPIS